MDKNTDMAKSANALSAAGVQTAARQRETSSNAAQTLAVAFSNKENLRSCAVCGKEFLPSRPGYEHAPAHGTTLRLSRRSDPMVEVRNRLAVFCCSLIARCLREQDQTERCRFSGIPSRNCGRILSRISSRGNVMEQLREGKRQMGIDHSRPISSFPITYDACGNQCVGTQRPM